MSYIFFGTPEFSEIILEKLIKADLKPALVVCNPDRPAGRKKVLTPPLTKITALEHGIPVFQPESLKSSGMASRLVGADFFIVASYGGILPKSILDLPRQGAIGVHPSLLPKYRGASPIQNTILSDEKETGVTLYMMDEKVDHGSIIAAQKIKLKVQNYETLLKELAAVSAKVLIKTLPLFIKEEVKFTPQNEADATYTKKFATADAYIDPKSLILAESGTNPEEAEKITRKIRALNPEPGVWTMQDGKRVKLLDAEIQDNKLKLKKIQIEGKKPTTLQGKN